MQPNQTQDPSNPNQVTPNPSDTSVQNTSPAQPVAPVAPVATQPSAPAAPVAPVAAPQESTASEPSEPQEELAPLDETEGADDTTLEAEDSQVPLEEPEEIEDPLSWSAHEDIHQEKGAIWFVVFGIVCLGFIGMSVLMQAWSFTALIIVIIFIVVVYLRRPPRELSYSLNNDGLLVDTKQYKYDDFKSFGVIEDRGHFSVVLIPTQRWQPSLTVYFPEEIGEDVVDILGDRMPMKNLKLDAVDRLIRMLRL